MPDKRLRKVVLICEEMWERRDLLPELQKICATSLIDLKLARVAGARPAGDVIEIGRLKKLLEESDADDAEAVLLYARPAILHDDLIGCLRSKFPTACLIGMSLDDKTNFISHQAFNAGPSYETRAGAFDYNLSSSRALVDYYHFRGLPCLYLPTATVFDPVRCAPATDEYLTKIAFVGAARPERTQLIEKIKKNGIPLKVFGRGWPDSEFAEKDWMIFRTTQINLGIGYNLPSDEITNLKNRDFDCPGAGGCYLTTYNWELAELYEIGKEILCYREINELAEMYAFYSRRPELCHRIAQRGQERALSEHTWERRFREAFRQIGLL